MTTRPGEPPAEADPWRAIPDSEPVPGAAHDGATAAPLAGTPSGSQQSSAGDKEWWDSPGMPWKHEPTHSDKVCMGWVAFIGLYGLAMLPLRGWLLGLNPQLLVSLVGSRSGTTAMGALASQHLAPWWPLAFLAGSLMSVKFDWVFWWAGKLWGRGMIEVWAGQSERSRRNYERAERWAHKLGWLGMFVAYVPIPLPLMQVIFVLAGSTGMSLKKFLLLDYLASTLWLALYFALGWMVGEPAVALLRGYAKIAMWVGIGLLVFVLASSYWSQRRRSA